VTQQGGTMMATRSDRRHNNSNGLQGNRRHDNGDGGMTTAKLVAPAPRASGSSSIAMGGMTTHIPFKPSRQALHAYTFILTHLNFFMEVPVKMAARVTHCLF